MSNEIELGQLPEFTIEAQRAARRMAGRMTQVVIKWQAEDVQTLTNWPIEECEDFLARNGKHLRDGSVEVGWEILEALIREDAP